MEIRKLYRLAKARKRKTRDLNQLKCIKDEEGKMLVEETLLDEDDNHTSRNARTKKGIEPFCRVI